MSCLCGHPRIRHRDDLAGRCDARTFHTLCFCNHYTSELTLNRAHQHD